MSFRVPTIERHRFPRQILFFALRSLRAAEDRGKPDISAHEHGIEVDSPLEEFFGEPVVLGAGVAEVPETALIGGPGIEAVRRVSRGALSLGIVNKFLEPIAGAILGKIAVLVAIILFIQWRPRGLFALRGRTAEAEG